MARAGDPSGFTASPVGGAAANRRRVTVSFSSGDAAAVRLRRFRQHAVGLIQETDGAQGVDVSGIDGEDRRSLRTPR